MPYIARMAKELKNQDLVKFQSFEGRVDGPPILREDGVVLLYLNVGTAIPKRMELLKNLQVHVYSGPDSRNIPDNIELGEN